MKFKAAALISMILISSTLMIAQDKPSVAIISIDTKHLLFDNAAMASLVRLETEKTKVFELKDKYDIAYIMEKNNIQPDECFGKNKLVEVGQLLEVDKILTGSAEKFGEKIIIILRLIDVRTEKIEKTDVTEYLNQQEEIQYMVQISVNNLLGLENEPNLVNLLVNYERPVSSPKTKVKLNGPRMGVTWTGGNIGKRLSAGEEQGGFNMFPVTSMFGYQYEVQYLSAGDFQALIEFIATIGGLETGNFIPSLTFMNGFRFNKGGWELGIGPVFRTKQVARGYYDSEGKWNLEEDMPIDANYEIEEEIDSRGEYEFSTGLILAVGKTFRSGYLNAPVNLYVSPRKEGTTIGMSIGFNIAKVPR